MTTFNHELVAEITREVVARLQAQMQQTRPRQTAIRDGVFPTVDEAVQAVAAATAQAEGRPDN